MRKVTLAVITVVVAAGAASIYAASNPSGDRLIPGSGPITEQQIRGQADGGGLLEYPDHIAGQRIRDSRHQGWASG